MLYAATVTPVKPYTPPVLELLLLAVMVSLYSVVQVPP